MKNTNKKKYYNLQKYLFNYFKQLGYIFYYNQEILLIPKKISYNASINKKNRIHGPTIQQRYNFTHTFTKEELCFILEKYFYFFRILHIAPLTKYLHLNFIFLKSKNENYYKIKINYVFATPKLKKTQKLLKLTLQFFLCSNNKHMAAYLLPKKTLEKLIPCARIQKINFLRDIKINKFLYLIKNKKFQRTHQFFNLLDKVEVHPIEILTSDIQINYPKDSKHYNSSLTGASKNNIADVLNFCEYIEMQDVHPYFHLTLTYKILLLNKFKFFKITSDFDFFYLLFFNYMLLKNIYYTPEKQVIQINQNNKYTSLVKQKLVSYSKNMEIYDSLLLEFFNLEEQILGTITWFTENIENIATTMSNILHVYISKDDILFKYHNMLTKLGKDKFLENLKVCVFPKKTDILEIKQYFRNPNTLEPEDLNEKPNWVNYMATYILLKESPEDIPEYFRKFDTPELPGILIFNNFHRASRDYDNLY